MSVQVWTKAQASEPGRWSGPEFALLVGVSNSTLKRWAEQKIVVPHRFHNRIRYYTEEHLIVVMGPEKGRFFMAEVARRVVAGRTFEEAARDTDRAWALHRTSEPIEPPSESSEPVERVLADGIVASSSDSSTSSGS